MTNTKFTIEAIFKWPVQWHEVHSRYCTTVTTISRIFLSCKTETLSPVNTKSQFSRLLAPGSHILLSVPENLAALGASAKWARTACVLLCLAASTCCRALGVPPCRSPCQPCPRSRDRVCSVAGTGRGVCGWSPGDGRSGRLPLSLPSAVLR